MDTKALNVSVITFGVAINAYINAPYNLDWCKNLRKQENGGDELEDLVAILRKQIPNQAIFSTVI